MKILFLNIVVLSLISLSACKDHSKELPAPTVYLDMPEGGFDIDKDSTLVIIPKITYDEGSNYEWILDEELVQTERDLVFEDQILATFNYTFTVTTSAGSDQMEIPVHNLDIVTFDDFENLNDDGYNNQADGGYFVFDHIEFSNHNPDANIETWSGFAVSDNTDKITGDASNQFSVYNSSGADDSKLFSVFKESESINHHIRFSDGKSHAIKSIEVNNTTLAYISMNQFFEKKEDKDFFLLTITGYDESGATTGVVEYYLADYRFETIAERQIISSWSTVDLEDLGNVVSIGFKLTSSINDLEENQIPSYFCLDNLKVKS
ncbi:DUF4465 domain-containing protein [Carboxylicivirga sp. N1Y90]|uniref:DUF4465 domain-containing protein n=1 Tax=Carboxylicivirga fragile TaxID=3417571 RepID=UPI003D349DFB|nr:DUF4465 domain-containing protein [Marinilabiliaceae bacterium N1Y90]